jgi:hypothetical protein
MVIRYPKAKNVFVANNYFDLNLWFPNKIIPKKTTEDTELTKPKISTNEFVIFACEDFTLKKERTFWKLLKT